MPILFPFIILVTVLAYAIVLIMFYLGLFRKSNSLSDMHPKISIVIAARNEENRLPELIEDLKKQTYPYHLLEILIADDHSEDKTSEIIRNAETQDARFKLIPVNTFEPGLTAKKNALAKALRQAAGEIILTTDADCRVLPTWVETMASYFSENVGAVIGFSQLCVVGECCSLFQKLQAVDFLMLMSAAYGSANWNRAWAASGQNMAYRKEVYDQVGGFREIGHRVSGDDVLFVQLIRNKTDWKVRFADSAFAFNRTQAEPSMSAFINQRKRWASNGAYQWKLNKPFFAYVVTTFLTNFILFISLPLAWIQPRLLPILFMAWALKCLAEGSLFAKGSSVFKRRDLTPVFPVWFFAQVPYVVFTGIFGTLGGFTWKDRHHASPEKT